MIDDAFTLAVNDPVFVWKWEFSVLHLIKMFLCGLLSFHNFLLFTSSTICCSSLVGLDLFVQFTDSVFLRSALSSENFYKQLEGFTGETVIVSTTWATSVFWVKQANFLDFVCATSTSTANPRCSSRRWNESWVVFFGVRFVEHERFEWVWQDFRFGEQKTQCFCTDRYQH